MVPIVNRRPTRDELKAKPVTLEIARPVLRDYVLGVLMTREEFIDSFDIETARQAIIDALHILLGEDTE